MLLKFLFGITRVVPVGKEDCLDNTKIKDAIFLTVKKDVFQHSDMAKATGIIPGAGGFVKRIRNADKAYFFGESISCRVSTDDSMMEVYTPLLTSGKIYMTEVKTGLAKHAVFMVCDKQYYPTKLNISELVWKEVSYQEMLDVMEGECNAGYDY